MEWIVKNILTNKRFDNIFYGVLIAIFIIDFGIDKFLGINILKLTGHILLLLLIFVKMIAYRITRDIFDNNTKTLSAMPDLLNERKYNEAISKLKRVRLYKNHITDKKYYRGVSYLNIKESKKALLDFNEVEGDYSDDARFFYNKGMALIDMGDNDEALNYLTKSINIEKTSQNLDQRGIVYMNLNKLDDAGVDIKESLELETNSINSCNYGVYHSHKGNYKEALIFYDKSIELDKSKAHVFYNRAMIHQLLKNWSSAIHDYDKANEMGHKNNDLYLNRGVCKCENGDTSDGVLDLNKAKELNCKDADEAIRTYNV